MNIKYVLIAFLICLQVNSIAQESIQMIKIKNEDRSVDLSIFNASEDTYRVKVTLELQGMKLSKPIKDEFLVAPGKTIAVATLIAIADETSYKIRYNAVPLDKKYADQYVIIDPEVTVYTKNNHKKSTQVKIYLDKNRYGFREINTKYNEDTKDMYEAMLARRGLKKSQVNLPVIVYKGEVFYNIKNMKKFLKEKFPPKPKKMQKKG